MASHSTARRIPQQQRGARRVAGLLEAAEAEIAAAGYEGATMSGIAERAGAAIGSLYQFFPSKACITQALRTEYAEQFDGLYEPLVSEAAAMDPDALASRLIDLNVHFVDTHPAFSALLEAPRGTRAPSAMCSVIRERFAGLLLAQNRRMSKRKALRLATVILHIIKALNELYVELSGAERRRFVQEFKVVLLAYFDAQLQPRAHRRVHL